VRELICFKQPRDDGRVQTIQTQNDDLLDDTNPVERMTSNSASAIALKTPHHALFGQGSQGPIERGSGVRQGRISVTAGGQAAGR
jgi:hypothetical protein